MNKIENEGKTYEVLTLDELKGHLPFQLYVRLASGQINEADYFPSSELVGVKVRCDQYEVGKYSLEAFGIQPLRLVPNEPVTFEGKVVGTELKPEFKSVWLTIEVAELQCLPSYYDMVTITGIVVGDFRPVTFEAPCGTNELGDACIHKGVPQEAYGKRFRCTKIVEEEA
jgi:hypothetical protein